MRGNGKNLLARERRKELETKRTVESPERRGKRRTKTKELAEGIQHSPAGKKAAEIQRAKRGIAQKLEQANFRRATSRVATRAGGRREQLEADRQGQLRESSEFLGTLSGRKQRTLPQSLDKEGE